MKKFLTHLHLWLALPFGLIIACICLTGSLLVFEDELLEIRYPERYFVAQTGETPLSPGEIVTKAKAQIPDSVTITGIKIEQEADRNYKLYVSKGDSYFVNPYTGEIAGQDERSSFFSKVIRLHRYMMQNYKKSADETPWGRWIIGTSTIVFICIILSGLFIWYPKNRKMLKNRLKVKYNGSRFRFWHDLHVAGGFYAAIFLLLMAFTGLSWSFQWYRKPFYTLFGADPAEITKKRKSSKQEIPAAIDYQQWDKVVAQMQNKYPDFNDITVKVDEATVTYADYGNIYEKDQYKFDLTNGEITQTTLNADRSQYSRLRNWVYCIHTGGWGGITSRILYLLATLTGLICALTGYYFWWKKTKNKKRK